MSSKADSYRANVEICLSMARYGRREDRSAWLELADTWRGLLQAEERRIRIAGTRS